MRECKVFKRTYIPATSDSISRFKEEFLYIAGFHEFNNRTDEDNSSYPCAIVEDKRGRIHVVDADCVQFINKEE